MFCGALSGLVSAGTVPSALSRMKLDRPPVTIFPFWSTSFAFTVMLAVGLLERAKTVLDAPECAAIVKVCKVTGAGNGFGKLGWFGRACWNDA